MVTKPKVFVEWNALLWKSLCLAITFAVISSSVIAEGCYRACSFILQRELFVKHKNAGSRR